MILLEENEKLLIENNLLNEGAIFDAFLLYSFLRRLVTPFKSTEAFKLGLIDKEGKILKHRKDLKTSQEKNAFTLFDLLVWNLKKILAKFPFGKTLLASYVAALFLIKEQKNPLMQDQVILYESFSDYMDQVQRNPKLREVIEKLMSEDAVTNSANPSTIGGLDTGISSTTTNSTEVLKRNLRM